MTRLCPIIFPCETPAQLIQYQWPDDFVLIRKAAAAENVYTGVCMNTKTLLIIYYIVVNLLGLGFMASDKIRAMEHRFRIPESVLLILSLIGGALGTLAGMFLFHI